MQVPAPFDYARASSVDDALALLERLGPEARLVAGGHSLLPMMKLRLATPQHPIDIKPPARALSYIREQGAEMLVEVRIPLRTHGGSAYAKVKRRTGDWATAAAGAAIWLDGSSIGAAGIALSAVNPTSVRSSRAEQSLIGGPPSEDAFAAAAALAAEDCEPIGDLRGPADYKRHLAHELTHRALRRAAERALAS